MILLRSLIAFVGLLALAKGHSYHMGSCPTVEPQSGFQMGRFLGTWYVIQKTSTASKCISYNYTRGDEPGEYIITQDSNHPVLGLTPLKHEYHYTGELTVPEPSTPGRMKVRFPLSVAGTASHVVFATDYDTYAGIFTCQSLAFAHRQSATILSRTKELDKSKVDQIRAKLTSFGVDPFELSIVPQTGCDTGKDPVDIDINPGTFTAENFGKLFKKAGEKIGDGVEWVANAGSKVYHKIAGSEEKEKKPITTTPPSYGKIETNDVEWIP
ncbi:apolipoprotein D [Fopius arisanus]|uniref:Apolipoprotein D n=1 Tax=Fopius arisanus TaxID=64838 RepID=A0A9R1T351_9HYME|nr:PREDICTED: apolipoprotein D-like [Fopius arisanus]XP_011301837.1 PREDICTED: apolipoprotein D-like [Fopius arisanus]